MTRRNRRLGAAAIAFMLAAVSPTVTGVTLHAQTAQAAQFGTTVIDGKVFNTWTDGEAVLEVQRDVEPGSTMRIRGTGWQSLYTDVDDNGNTRHWGATIALKLEYTRADGRKDSYARTGDKVLRHPTNRQPDPTLWELFDADHDGSFDMKTSLPAELQPGQRLVVRANSGLLETDKNRRASTQPLVVGGKPYEGREEEEPKCVTDLKVPTVEVAKEANPDGTLTITGQGWCNEIAGAREVAVKIDEGAISRLESNKLHSNLTIWDIIYPEPTTGNFVYNMPLPNGTTSGPLGSSPAFEQGQHSLRFLTGTLKDGDPQFSVPTRPQAKQGVGQFVVGAYKPSGIPEPLLDDGSPMSEVTEDKKNGVSVKVENGRMRVVVPGRPVGSWAYLRVHLPNGSAQRPWNYWVQSDANGVYDLPVPGNMPLGRLKVVVQGGNQDEQKGVLVGWAYHEFVGSPGGGGANTPAGGTDGQNSGNQGGGGTVTPAASATTTAQPASVEDIASAIDGFTRELENLDNIMGGGAVQTVAPTPDVEPGSIDDAGISVPAGRTTTIIEEPAGGAAAQPGVNPGANSAGPGGVRVVQPGESGSQPAANESSGGDGGNNVADDKPMPDKTPRTPVSKASNLRNTNVKGVSGSLDGDLFSITVPGAKEGSWVFVYHYPEGGEPQPLGWVRVGPGGVLTVDTSALGPGVHKFALVSEDEALLGWAGVEFAVEEEGNVAAVPYELMSQSRTLTQNDWSLIVGALAVIATGGIWASAFTARSRRFS
ncbi:hypothetical protein [Corynebacterium aquatimens]|uniref:Uncharacterized protein n=1 Tax=Corynebacterium aquatimens TaxID=1190508 RepID=A0A931DUA2_9CORY|nr:hypothetical protein [Corynebacterium aquatimens]MBG6121599.1 hypothetical protein [Corynebacterium aquatimens]WJY65861.1 hypothetical protein CAQUA_05770 [Corynebacterium aquatimens]